MHLNVCSILAKQTELKELLIGLYIENLHLDAILLCETYLNRCTQNLVNIPKFNLICKNRTNKKNGGVPILIKDHFNYTAWEDISNFKEGEFESVFIDIHFKKGHDITLGSVYRVPGTSETRFISRIKQVINKIQETKNEIDIGTDQNIDSLKINNNHALNLHNTLMSLEVLPIITKPTRITHSTDTLINNIYLSKNLAKDVQSSIQVEDLSDNLPCDASINRGDRIYTNNLTLETRKLDRNSIDNVRTDLNWTNGHELSGSNSCVNYCYNTLKTRLLESIDTFALKITNYCSS